jgi:hypothetical protein
MACGESEEVRSALSRSDAREDAACLGEQRAGHFLKWCKLFRAQTAPTEPNALKRAALVRNAPRRALRCEDARRRAGLGVNTRPSAARTHTQPPCCGHVRSARLPRRQRNPFCSAAGRGTCNARASVSLMLAQTCLPGDRCSDCDALGAFGTGLREKVGIFHPTWLKMVPKSPNASC